MSVINCDSCANLREYAPSFVQNGTTDVIAASLKNNTGLNPALTVTHDNCDDLNDANDCLIGRMADEVEAYDVCDWKEFMGKFLPNQYELMKAIIANDCGMWSHIYGACQLAKQLLNPTLVWQGVWSPDYLALHPEAKNFGHLVLSEGSPVVFPSEWDGTERGKIGYSPCFGLYIGVSNVTDCETGAKRTLLRWAPLMYQYFTNNGFSYPQDVWYATRSEFVELLGETVGNYLVNAYFSTVPETGERVSRSSSFVTYTGGNRKNWWWRLYGDVAGAITGTGEDTIIVQYNGSTVPDPLVAPPYGTSMSSTKSELQTAML